MNAPQLTELFSSVIMLSWRAGWLIVVLAALRLAVRGRVPAQVWFVAWILVALRLLLPFSVPVEWSPYNLTAAQPPKTESISRPAAPMPHAPVETLPLVVTEQPKSIVAPVTPSVTGSRVWTRTEVLAAVWLAGVAILAAARMAASWSFRRRLRQARPLTDGRVTALVAQESASVRVTLLETDAVDAPALYGLVRPRLLLPPGLAAKLTDDELRHVVRHELGHWRRRDLLAQALMQAAVAVHWFNPLAWLAARLARADCELACDEFVLRRESPTGASAYGATLLKVLGVVRGRRRPVAVVAMLENKEQLTQRIRMIAGYRALTMSRVLAGVALIAAITAASLTRESQAQEKLIAPTLPPKRSDGTVTIGGGQLTVAQTQTSPAVALDISKAGDGTLALTASQPQPNSDAASVVEAQTRKVEQLRRALEIYREQNGAVALDQRADILNETLRATNLEAARVQQARNTAESRVKQIADTRARGADLTDLGFIASQPLVAQLRQQRVDFQLRIKSASERYLEQHPVMRSLTSNLAQTEEQLRVAVDSACRQIEAEFDEARRRQEQIKTQLDQQMHELGELERVRHEYGRLQQSLRTSEQTLATLAGRAEENPATATPAARARQPGEFTVSVVGAVNQQGGIIFSSDDKPITLDAIARAGGFAARAERGAVSVIRLNPDGSRSTYTLTEQELMTGADKVGVLRRGDIVVVSDKPPAVPAHVTVGGQVVKPGIVLIPPGGKLSLVDAITMSGGPTRTGKLRAVSLSRLQPDGYLKKILVIDVEQLMRGEVAETYPLEAGDFVYVPERTL